MKTLEIELKESSAQVGYMIKWLAFQQENGGFMDQEPVVVEWFVNNIDAARRWRESIYKKNRIYINLRDTLADPKEVEQAVAQMCLWMLKIGGVWVDFRKNIVEFRLPVMPYGRTKKDKELHEILEFEYDPEKFA